MPHVLSQRVNGDITGALHMLQMIESGQMCTHAASGMVLASGGLDAVAAATSIPFLYLSSVSSLATKHSREEDDAITLS